MLLSERARGGRRDFLRKTALAAAGLALGPRLVGARARAGALTLAAGGDAIVTRPLRGLTHPAILSLIEQFRGADVGFFNCEMTFHDVEGYPAATGACGDLNLIADPRIVADLRWAGFNLTSLANNHTLDYGHGGLQATLRHLKKNDIVAAGAGDNLAQARAPRYLDTRNGRVALIGCASTFRVGSEASAGHDEIPGRPGLSPLRVRRVYELPASRLAALRETQRLLQGGDTTTSAGDVRFLGNTFREGPAPRVLMEADAGDQRAIVEQVARARAEADLVLVTIHAHESGSTREEPASFLQPFARACIDAGAHSFLGHGPHVIRPLEMYRGMPIFYSLGNLYFQAETISQIPQEIYDNCGITSLSPSAFFEDVMPRNFDAPGTRADEIWEAIVPHMRFSGGRLETLALHPVHLFRDLPPTQRGTPGLASGEIAERILARQQKLSAPWGTTITIRNGIAEVRLS
ncbi:MAG TPA: CapA family protein [Vicinamibacterales bacterium]|nr:CapA family protein [Vicinamibacterales bacterium]